MRLSWRHQRRDRLLPLRRTARGGWALAVRLEPLEGRCLPSTVRLAGAGVGLPLIPADATTQTRISQAYGQILLSFEANRGQVPGPVDYLARGPGYVLYLSAGSAELGLQAPGADASATADVLAMHLVGAAAAPALGLDPLAGHSNYLIGDDPAAWHTDVPTYGRVEYDNVYPGIDLVYYGNQRQLEYDFVLGPGADPRAIDLAFEGAPGMALDDRGDLVLHTAGGDVVEQAPVVYQEGGAGPEAVAGHYVLEGGGRVGFAVGAYDPGRALVIDPVLNYSTYLGGISQDTGNSIAVDAAGDAYVTGYTFSPNFPGTPVAGLAPAVTRSDIFVTKLNASGTGVIYSSLIGGTRVLAGNAVNKAAAVALDSQGDAYITGFTNTSDFPTLNAWQAAYGGGTFDAYVAELNAAGTGLVYSSYLGGSGQDQARAIAVDAAGHAYVTGLTSSTDFMTLNALQSSYAGGPANLPFDAFVTEVNAGGGSLVYSTYLGGGGDDQGLAIAVDASGSAYVTGLTSSAGLATAGAWQPVYHPGGVKGDDGFVAQLRPGGAGLAYFTYLGGSGDDLGAGIALGSGGQVYVAGTTTSADFVTTPGVVDSTYNLGGGGTGNDVFVTELAPGGATAVYSTYLGGSGDDEDRSLALDGAGDAYVVGLTTSTDFQTANPLQPTNHGGPTGQDAFITELNPSGTALVYSTYLGGTGDDQANDITLDGNGNVYVVGQTNSSDFPTVNAVQSAFGGGRNPDGTIPPDTFVAKISLGQVPVANPDSYTTALNTPLVVGAPGVLANDTDAENDALTAVLVKGPAHGQLTLNADGSFNYTPNTGYYGSDSFTYAAQDRDGPSAPAAVSLTVTGAPPVANPDSYSTGLNTALAVGAPGVLANDTDLEHDPLTAVLLSNPAHGQVTLNPDGSFTYIPAPGYRGPDGFTYSALDKDGPSPPASVSISVVGAVPVASPDAYTVTGNSTLSVPADGVLANDTDAEGDPLTAVLVNGPAHGQLTLNPDGSFSYTPVTGYRGPDSFTYAAKDQDGSSVPVAVFLSVTGTPPVANPDSYSTVGNSTLVINTSQGVLANDTDAEGDALTAVLVNGPAHGQLHLNPNGSFSYTPAAGYRGPDSFTYAARDVDGSSNPATVSIQVGIRPTAIPAAYTTTGDSTLNVPAAQGVLVGDTDAEGDPLTAVLVNGPGHGQLTLSADGSFSYTPAAGFRGADTFTYAARDVDGPSAPATVTITVAPQASLFLLDVAPSGTAGGPLTVTVTAVNADGTVASGYTGSVVFTSSDQAAQVPASYQFVPADHGVHTFTNAVILDTAGSQTVRVADTTAGITGMALVLVSPVAASQLQVTAPPSTIAGQHFSVTITALDQFGNVATGYVGTIHLSTSDTGAGVVLPADYTFTAADAGTHTFTGAVTLSTAGTQTLTAADTATPSITGAAAVTVIPLVNLTGAGGTAGSTGSGATTAAGGQAASTAASSNSLAFTSSSNLLPSGVPVSAVVAPATTGGGGSATTSGPGVGNSQTSGRTGAGGITLTGVPGAAGGTESPPFIATLTAPASVLPGGLLNALPAPGTTDSHGSLTLIRSASFYEAVAQPDLARTGQPADWFAPPQGGSLGSAEPFAGMDLATQLALGFKPRADLRSPIATLAYDESGAEPPAEPDPGVDDRLELTRTMIGLLTPPARPAPFPWPAGPDAALSQVPAHRQEAALDELFGSGDLPACEAVVDAVSEPDVPGQNAWGDPLVLATLAAGLWYEELAREAGARPTPRGVAR
jgi:VCBS repeat-containing protein